MAATFSLEHLQEGVYSRRLTFGSPQHEAKTFAVFLLQQHRLLLDYVVTGRDERKVKLDTRQTSVPG